MRLGLGGEVTAFAVTQTLKNNYSRHGQAEIAGVRPHGTLYSDVIGLSDKIESYSKNRL